MLEKVRLHGVMTKDEYKLVKKRADKLGLHMGAYVYKMAVYESNYNMLPRLDNGARLAGRKKK